MSEILGDLRRNPETSLALAQASLQGVGYVVVSDSDPIDLNPHFRTDILPQYRSFLREDTYSVPPLGRLRADGLANYVVGDDGSVRLTRDYAQVAIPVWSGNRLTQHRVYPNGLPLMDHPVARHGWKGLLRSQYASYPAARGQSAYIILRPVTKQKK